MSKKGIALVTNLFSSGMSLIPTSMVEIKAVGVAEAEAAVAVAVVENKIRLGN